MNELAHLAIIMDGNGRWAQAQNKARIEGHKAGAKIVRDITIWCAKNTIEYLTLYAFSTENWKRPKAEVNFLMKLLLKYLKSEKKTYLDNNIRFKAIGDISLFNNPLKEMILDLEECTKNNTNLTQILALNYGSRDEILRCFQKIFHKYTAETILEKIIQENLDTAGIPDVDLLIRTGGEQRISNFLLWQISYAELHFTQTFWPDFNTQELESIITNFKQRNRRFGGL
ncbi:di-trans,poly-cis-decaprenylcistransferase [Helicobacter anseris]|uniref:Isoprenyl transferase n=1 Tax=Helicobacter anseris TaxID=375926 RepID=A0A3D8J8Q4_9HELI|nr:di-trans,poly-cis-decaprenylcistransferase [Helicobacter anseris]RDU73575.1 di-trans,poly-cis-decaprenylcistransferase [Helicobacter anseris]